MACGLKELIVLILKYVFLVGGGFSITHGVFFVNGLNKISSMLACSGVKRELGSTAVYFPNAQRVLVISMRTP